MLSSYAQWVAGAAVREEAKFGLPVPDLAASSCLSPRVDLALFQAGENWRVEAEEEKALSREWEAVAERIAAVRAGRLWRPPEADWTCLQRSVVRAMTEACTHGPDVWIDAGESITEDHCCSWPFVAECRYELENGMLRPATKSVRLNLWLISQHGDPMPVAKPGGAVTTGTMFTLRLDLIESGGFGELVEAPSMAFLMDTGGSALKQAVRLAHGWANSNGLWPGRADVRWEVEWPPKSVATPAAELVCPTPGVAFAVGLLVLLQPETLESCALESLAVSAQVMR